MLAGRQKMHERKRVAKKIYRNNYEYSTTTSTTFLYILDRLTVVHCTNAPETENYTTF